MYELEKSKLSKLREQVQMQEKPGKELCKMCSIKITKLTEHKETNLHKQIEDILKKKCCGKSLPINEYQRHLTSSKHLSKGFGNGKIV